LLSQFLQSLVVILIAAGAVTAFLREWVESGVIFGVVVINALVGFLQEARAIKAIEALAKVMTTEATVVRGGVRLKLPAHELVPGDLVVVQSGDKVPADLRLTYSRDVHIDESALTGESLPVEKRVDAVTEDIMLADRTNMAYASTLCTRGQGAGVVVATGDATEVGKISHLISEAEQLKTPLTRKIAQLSRLLLFVILGLAVMTAIVGIVRGEPVVDMFIAGVALAVGAIPEGLPAAVTIVLSIGVSRMARRRAIIRRLPAVETLGSTTVICSDKTGTLTENQMTVVTAALPGGRYSLTGQGYTPEGGLLDSNGRPVSDLDGAGGSALLELFRAGLLCNDSSLYFEEGRWSISGDPTEGALIVSAAKVGLNRETEEHSLPRVDTLPFESEYQYMATLHRTRSGERVAYVKGATERLLARAGHALDADGSLRPLDADWFERQAAEMASTGLRVLAFARKDMPASAEKISHEDVEEGLVLLGLQGMIDPPRVEAIRAVEVCHTAGIQVKMITGDHALTAGAIAEKLHLRGPGQGDPDGSRPVLPVLTGSALEAITDADLPDAAENTYVFARVTPEQKLRLVTALQGKGHIVAMTGDGVNDGPALRQADIGVAMGITGTEVAKEAADMVLTDDNFASIEAAVEEGRGVFDNLTKFITWTLPTNLAEGLVIVVAILGGLVLPILPVQILWINMTTAVVLGMTLAFEAKEEGIMRRPPRPARAPILDQVLIGRIFIVGFVLLAEVYALFEYAQHSGLPLAEARTVASNIIVFGELTFLFNCRSLASPSWKVPLRNNRFLIVGVLLMVALQLLYTYLPGMSSLFSTAALSPAPWAWIIGAAVLVHIVIEFEKWVRRARSGR
jgi:Ca2+-transporting ATPase